MKISNKIFLFFCVIFFTCAFSLDEELAKLEEFKQFPDIVYEQVHQYYPRLTKEETLEFYHLLLKQAAMQPEKPKEPEAIIVPFNCQTYSREGLIPPTSVHNVRIPFIDVVAALGDSITAGFGAKSTSIFNMFTEYRGVSWSIGGDSNLGNVLTLPNLLRMYNQNLTGFSTGTGGATSSGSRFNQAVSGAVASDIPNQARTLHNLMSKDPNFSNTYKLITIFIGGNDLCDACNNWSHYSAENYELRLRTALDFIAANFPNTIVNLVPVIDVTELYELKSLTCTLLHAFECKCGTSDANTRKQVSQLQVQYVEAAARIANDSKYTSNNFTVVLQPFMTKTFVPKLNGSPDMSFFALDCFHLSEKGHQAATVPLWNNINEKFGQKEAFWEGPKESLHCPTPDDFIWTSRNS